MVQSLYWGSPDSAGHGSKLDYLEVNIEGPKGVKRRAGARGYEQNVTAFQFGMQASKLEDVCLFQLELRRIAEESCLQIQQRPRAIQPDISQNPR